MSRNWFLVANLSQSIQLEGSTGFWGHDLDKISTENWLNQSPITTEIRDWAVVTADIEANGTKTSWSNAYKFPAKPINILMLIISWVDLIQNEYQNLSKSGWYIKTHLIEKYLNPTFCYFLQVGGRGYPNDLMTEEIGKVMVRVKQLIEG